MTENCQFASLHDAYASSYDESVKAYDCYVTDVLFGLSYSEIHSAERLLDLGIGTGLLAASYHKAGLIVSGMDYSQAMLEICREKQVTVDLKLHDLLVVPWPFPDAGFHHVTCCGVFHFIPELEGIFNEIRRVIREGGCLAFTSKAPLDSEIKIEVRTSSGMDIYSHSPGYLHELIEKNRFEVQKRMRCFVGEDVFWAWVVKAK